MAKNEVDTSIPPTNCNRELGHRKKPSGTLTIIKTPSFVHYTIMKSVSVAV
jgi:hypothetical protein